MATWAVLAGAVLWLGVYSFLEARRRKTLRAMYTAVAEAKAARESGDAQVQRVLSLLDVKIAERAARGAGLEELVGPLGAFVCKKTEKIGGRGQTSYLLYDLAMHVLASYPASSVWLTGSVVGGKARERRVYLEDVLSVGRMGTEHRLVKEDRYRRSSKKSKFALA